MEVQELISESKELYSNFMNMIEAVDDSQSYLSFIDLCERKEIKEKREEIMFIMHLMIKVSENHYRNANFFDKIEKIILHFKDEIKQAFTDSELYLLCKNNKRMLYFMFKEKIIEFDETIFNDIKSDYSQNARINYLYFLNESKSFLPEKTIRKMEKEISPLESIESDIFDEKRKIGENDSYLCKLIHDDSIDEFITFFNRQSLKSSSKIKPSIFETNSFLLRKREITLIEYAAFFGSTQILKYLQLNYAPLDKNIWLYAIHSNNGDLIHMIEELGIKPQYEECLKESIKCHHNSIANYIFDMYKDDDQNDDNMLEYAIKNYNYSLIPDDMISMISKARKKNEFGFQSLGSIVERITIPSSITTIGNNAFKGCSYLKEVTIPSSVTIIESHAFSECSSLEQIIIPSSVTSMGGSVFSGCKKLKEITIPSSAVSIKGGCFYNCTSLETISILSSITSIEPSFACGCESLKQISIPSSVTSIKQMAFKNCTSLIEIVIPSSVTSIDDCAFYGCISLKEIIIPPSVTSIGDYTFYGCASLVKINIPSSVREIGKLAFKECSSLISISIPFLFTDLKRIGVNKQIVQVKYH